MALDLLDVFHLLPALADCTQGTCLDWCVLHS
jgi:hypothetical protein